MSLKHKPIMRGALAALTMAAALFAPYSQTQASPMAAKPTELNGVRETMLPNGLTILTKEVHAAPVAYFAVYYKVGSIDEVVGQTGMSHLMEHMMFKGTKSRGPGVISATLKGIGAINNASTWFDRTEYHETLAADHLDVAMQIESDRMVNSLYDEAQHQKEMTVVRSEYEAGENVPSRVLSKAVRLTAYQVHPYRWQTIGFRSDIENFSRDEMYAYYKNFYTPNNATVVIVGDFDTPSAIAMVTKYFGGIKPHPVHLHFITPEPEQEGERRVIVRRAGPTPLVKLAYHICGFGNPDHYALDILETVLSSGRTGRFFQHIVQPGIASLAEAGDDNLSDPDLLAVEAAAQPGHTPEELEKALLAELDALKTTPITADELARALRQSESSYILRNDSVEQQGSELGEDAMRGDWRYGETYLDNLRRVTASDVQRVAQKYLTARNRTVGYFEPVAKTSAAAPGSGAKSPGTLAAMPAVPPSLPPPQSQDTPAPAITTISMTTPHPAQRSTAKPATRVVLDNGITVVVQENHANPSVSVSGSVGTICNILDPPGRRGLAAFTVDLLSRGTKSRSLLDIARLLEGVGASASISPGEEYASISGISVSKDFDIVLDVLADELRRPSFPQDEVEKARSQALAQIANQRQDTGTLARISLADALYPAGHPYHAATLDELEATYKSLTRESLVSFHDSHYCPDRVRLTIAGDIDTDAAIAAVKKYFGDWRKDGNIPPMPISDTPVPPGPAKVFVIPVADKAQVDIRYGFPGLLKLADPDFYADSVLYVILGGGLSSRLSVAVRDRAGLVYDIRASTVAALGQGPFVVSLGCNPANVDKAIAEMNTQLDLMYDKGVTAQEVEAAKSYIMGSFPVALSTNMAVTRQMLIGEFYGLGPDYLQKRNSYYKAVTTDQVNAAIRKYLHPGTGALVISGTYAGKYAPAAGH